MVIDHIPILETGRLRLRGHLESDLERAFAIWSNPEVVRHIGIPPSTRQQSWGRICNYRGHWQLMGFGYWAVEEKVSGLYVGDVGIADFKRDFEIPNEQKQNVRLQLQGIPETGWALSPSVHGRGYATEAVQAALQWGDVNLPRSASGPKGDRTFCILDPSNKASRRVAEKCGFREISRIKYAEHDAIAFDRMTK